MKINCPQCNTEYDVPFNAAGNNAECDVCGIQFKIPEHTALIIFKKSWYIICVFCAWIKIVYLKNREKRKIKAEQQSALNELNASQVKKAEAEKPVHVKCPQCFTVYEIAPQEVGNWAYCDVCGKTYRMELPRKIVKMGTITTEIAEKPKRTISNCLGCLLLIILIPILIVGIISGFRSCEAQKTTPRTSPAHLQPDTHIEE